MTKPGTSTEFTTGQVDPVQMSTKRASFSEASAVQAAAVVLGVGGKNSDRPTAEAREAGDQRSAEGRAQLEARVAVGLACGLPSSCTDAAGRAALSRAAPARAGREGRTRRRSAAPPRRWGEVRGALELCRRQILLVVGDVVDAARAGLDPGAAELLLVRRLAHCCRDRVGRQRTLRRVSSDDREVRADDARRPQAGDWAERPGDDGHDREVAYHELEAGSGGT